MSSDVLQPPITDASGYAIRKRDTRFLGLADEQVADWRARRRPLGVSERQYKALVDALLDALAADGINLLDCDIRLQGSSARFFSGLHKPMTVSRDDVIDAFRNCRDRVPEEWEVDEIWSKLTEQWISDGSFPQQRPFDAMYVLSVDRERSDYDIQISSDDLVHRCEQVLIRLGQDPVKARVWQPTYNFLQRHLVEEVAQNLYLRLLRMSDALGRGVTVAVFSRCGPPEVKPSPSGPVISSHFKDTDWIIWSKRAAAHGVLP